MGKSIVKSNDLAPTSSLKLNNNNNLKKGKEQLVEEKINIKLSKTNHQPSYIKVKTLASDHFSKSDNSSKTVQPTNVNKKVRYLLLHKTFILKTY